MKTIVNDENNVVVFLSNSYVEGVDFENKYTLEAYFKDLFTKLKKYYDINISGYYDITVYIDKHYGVILDLNKEDLDYFEYYDTQVDMHISIVKNSCFLYKIYDYFNISDEIKNKVVLYKYHNKLYLKIINNISDIDLGKMLENSELIYGIKAENIILQNKLIKL